MKKMHGLKTALTAVLCILLLSSAAVYADDYPQYHAQSSAETGISLSSDVYTVDNANCSIEGVTDELTVSELISAISVTGGGKIVVMRDGSELSDSATLLPGDILKIYTLDFTGSKEYVIVYKKTFLEDVGPIVKLGHPAASETAPGYYESGRWDVSGILDEDGNRSRVVSNNLNLWASWRPTISETGEYEVLYYQGYHATAWAGTGYYTIHHINKETGEATTTDVEKVNVAGASGWVSLGTYTFNEGTDGFVSIHYKNASDYNACRTAGMKFVCDEGVTCTSEDFGEGGIFSVSPQPLNMTLNFSSTLNTDNINENISLIKGGRKVPVNVNYNDDNKTLTLTTENALDAGARYVLKISKELTSPRDIALVRDYVYIFDTSIDGISLNRAIIPYDEGSIAGDYNAADTLLGVVSVEASDSAQTLCVIMCCFNNDNKLIDFDAENVTLSEYESKDIQLVTDVSGGNTAEIYVWDGTNFYTLCDAYTVAIGS